MSQPVEIFVTRTNDAEARARSGVAVAATVYSEPWSGTDADGAAIHIYWTGTPTGNLQLWLSDLPQPDRATDNDWVQDTTFGTAGNVALGGAAGKFRDDSGNQKARWKRIKLATGASTGTLFGFATVPRFR